ncbi:hypothetical protein SteCoe_6650 [Stentor coeruleus]|uniref:PAS domain-containing protein n=1 Tax=Stentor coeruleus TaxID=5963 RepID=A0A1R2CPF8_9CILI|nr:hypothetical protein SteCoe_6650 [Stentor coeruleus]
MFKILTLNYIILAQNIQLLWNPELTINSWDKYSKFWEIIRIPSFDAAAAKFNVLPQFFYVLVADLGIILALIISLCILRFIKRKPPVIVLAIARFIWTVTSEIVFIPAIICFMIVFKYSSGNYVYVQEYVGEIIAENMNFGSSGKILSAFLCFLVIVYTFVYESCAFDIKVENEKSLNDSRLHGKVNISIRIISMLNCILYVFFQKTNYEVYLILFIVLHGLLSFGMVYYIPYYSIFVNFMQFFVQFNCSCTAIFFLIGDFLNTAQIPFITTIIFQPILLILSYETVLYRFSHIPEPCESFGKPFEIYALSIRKYLGNGELKEGLIKSMNNNYKAYPNKLNRLLQTYYCIDELKNPILGLNKIITTSHGGLDIFSNFQVYKCKSALKTYCSENCEGFKLYKYFVDFALTKEKDHFFCNLYSNFLSKMLEKSPELKKLKFFVKELAQNMKKLKTNYEELITSFPSAFETKEMYGSLLIHIFCEVEIGHKYMSKMPGSDNLHMKIMLKNNFNFTSDRCFFVVSGKELTLGKIIYYNKNFINLIGISDETIHGFYLDEIIPPLFRDGHNKHLKNFLENHTNNIIFHTYSLCILDASGYLVECIISSETIGYKSSVDFICTIDPVKSKDKEMAIITPNGYIWSHTKGFPLMLGFEVDFVEHKFLNSLIPDIDIENLKPNQLVKVLIRDIEKKKFKKCLNFLLKIEKVGKVSIYFLYVSADEAEMRRFMTDRNEDLNIDPNKSKIFASYMQSNFEEFKTNVVKKVAIFDERGSRADIDKDNEMNEKSKISSHSSSVTFLTFRESLSLNKAIRVLNITKLVLLISTIVIIASNIAILSYISKEVNHSNSLQAFNHLSSLAYAVSQMALYMRMVDLGYQNSLDYQSDLNRTLNNLELLKTYQNLLFSDYDSWSYCKSSKIIKKSVIPYWVLENKPTLKTGTLHEIIGLLIQNAYEIIAKIEKNDNSYDDNLFFIIFNSLGSSFQQTNLALKNLVTCELNRVDKLSTIKNYLLIIAIVILAASALFMVFYLLSIDKFLNILWEYVRKRVHSGYFEVKHLVLERLTQYHNEIENTENESEHVDYKSKKELKFWHSFMYISRFSLLFFFGGLFFGVSILVFYENIHGYLIYRPTLVYTLMRRRIEMTEICIYTLEYELGNSTLSIKSRFPMFNDLKEPKQAAENALDSIVTTRKVLREKGIIKLMSPELFTKIYERISGVSTFISLGTFRGLAFLVQEARYIVFNNMSDSLETLKIFFSHVLEYNSLSVTVSLSANSDSKEIIEKQLSKLIYFNGFCCFFLCMIYLLYFYPFLCGEIDLVHKITKILMIIPQTIEVKPMKSRNESTKANKI